MIYKNNKYPNYNLINIKTDKYKSCQIEVVFKKNISIHDMTKRALLSEIMCFSTNNYPTRKELIIKCQDLYDVNITSSVNRLGNLLITSYNCSFIDPKYIKDETYLEDVIKLLFEVIFNPNINNNSFDLRSFNIVKTRLLNDIDSIKEDSSRVAISNALKHTFKNSVINYSMIHDKDYLLDFTSDMLYDTWIDMINNDLCDIFTIGDIDDLKLNNYINKYFKNNIIKTKDINLYLDNNYSKRLITKSEPSNFVQSNLVMIYSIDNIPKNKMQITPFIFNYIFGNGSLNSKLFRYLREENSLCYGVNCLYVRFDKILIIKVALAKENVTMAINLIRKALKEMVKGIFLEKDLDDAKKSAIFSVKMSTDYIGSLLNNYLFNYIDNLPLPDERINIIKDINKEDICTFAKSLKLRSIYVLESEESDETN